MIMHFSPIFCSCLGMCKKGHNNIGRWRETFCLKLHPPFLKISEKRSLAHESKIPKACMRTKQRHNEFIAIYSSHGENITRLYMKEDGG